MMKRRLIRSLTTALAIVVGTADQAPVTANARSAAVEVPAHRTLRLERIRILGNQRTDEDIILSHIGLEPGDPVDVDVFETTRVRLLETDYFTRVNLFTRPGTERGAVVLVVVVHERGRTSFETGFGFDDTHGWFLTLLGLRFDNPFGTDSRLRVGWRAGFRISGLDAEWERPVTAVRPLGLGVKVHAYNQNHLFFGSGPTATTPWLGDEWRRFQQDISRVGGEIALRIRLSDFSRASIGIHAEVVDPDSGFTDKGLKDDDVDYAFPDLPPQLMGAIDKTNINGFVIRLVRDTRDYPSYPRSGSYSRLTFVGNTKALGSDADFTKTTVDLRSHMPLGERSSFSSRLSAGLISSAAPYYDRFHIGGIYSIRGFEEWSLSPTDGDDGFWLVNYELRFPLTFSDRTTQPRLVGVLFVDAGQGWRRDGVFRINDIESAAGYGLRLRLPWVGTLGLDAAVPFTNGRTTDDFRVHGSLGFSF